MWGIHFSSIITKLLHVQSFEIQYTCEHSFWNEYITMIRNINTVFIFGLLLELDYNQYQLRLLLEKLCFFQIQRIKNKMKWNEVRSYSLLVKISTLIWMCLVDSSLKMTMTMKCSCYLSKAHFFLETIFCIQPIGSFVFSAYGVLFVIFGLLPGRVVKLWYYWISNGNLPHHRVSKYHYFFPLLQSKGHKYRVLMLHNLHWNAVAVAIQYSLKNQTAKHETGNFVS